MDLPIIILVSLSAVISAINPCTIGVLVLTFSGILGQGSTTARLFKSGLAYILAFSLTYVALGLAYSSLLDSLPLDIVNNFSILIGLLLVVAGLVQIKDFFWYGKGYSLQIPSVFANSIHKKSLQHKSTFGVFSYGMFVALAELPCIGAAYFGVLTIISGEFSSTSVYSVALYNLLFVIPLFIILIKLIQGKKISKISKWKEKNKPLMRLVSGNTLIILGWILLLSANGTVSF